MLARYSLIIPVLKIQIFFEFFKCNAFCLVSLPSTSAIFAMWSEPHVLLVLILLVILVMVAILSRGLVLHAVDHHVDQIVHPLPRLPSLLDRLQKGGRE
jgi:hypothetical protein